MFEIFKTDLAGRIGVIQTNHGSVQTPAYVPVIHPVKQTIPPALIKEMGFEMIITNAYITRNHYGAKEAEARGIHDIIGFDGAIMTDSGGYQVLEYGDLDVTPDEMAEFERGIMTDIAIPLDKPTGFGLPLKEAESYVRHTQKVSKRTLQNRLDNGQIWLGPIQGGEHRDLVSQSARGLVKAGFKMLALGSPVEFMESYQYKLLAEMIITAKVNIPHSIPLHLFGAGHPLTIPLAVALGCDTFDSASYILYAKQHRYITPDGTRHLKDIKHFPCNCAVCTRYTPNDLQNLDKQESINQLAIHNLHAIKLEVDTTRQAIYEGRLWEYVTKKARAHPKLYEVLNTMAAFGRFFDAGTPIFKERAIFLYDKYDQFRPEVLAYHRMVRNFRVRKDASKHVTTPNKLELVIIKESNTKPGYLSRQYTQLKKRFGDRFEQIQICQYSPHLGLIPIELSDIYPAAHHETARIHFEPMEFTMFAATWKIFFEKNSFTTLHYDHNDYFLGYFVEMLPHTIMRESL